MSEYIHVHLIDKQPVGSNLGEHIPLHMTALHWFQVEGEPREVIERTEKALEPVSTLATLATTEDLFGPEHDVPVMRLRRDRSLIRLHLLLQHAMEELGANFDPRWTGETNWNPHVTHRPDRRLHPGDKVEINDIDLVTRTGKNNDRIILKRFSLIL